MIFITKIKEKSKMRFYEFWVLYPSIKLNQSMVSQISLMIFNELLAFMFYGAKHHSL